MSRLYRVTSWLLGAATLALAALLCLHAIAVYRLGTSPVNLSDAGVLLSPIYSWENVSARLTALLPWGIGYAVLAIVCMTLKARAGREKNRLRPDDETLLRLRKRAVGFLQEDAVAVIGLPAQAVREESYRRRTLIGMTIILLPLGLLAASWLLNRENFTSWDLEAVLGEMMFHAGLPVLLILSAACITSWTMGRSIRRELAALREMPVVRRDTPAAGRKKRIPVNAVRAVLFAASIIMIIDGISNGGLRDVLIKAINICTECIGLG